MMRGLALLSCIAGIALAAETPDGLTIEIKKPVTCQRPTRAGDMVQMHYTGTLENGRQFDSSRNRGLPFAFRLGAGQVIKGWDQGLLDMCIGEQRKLTIAPALAYGDSGVGSIPPHSTLIFETELMGIAGVKSEAPVNPETPTPAEAAAQGIKGTGTESTNTTAVEEEEEVPEAAASQTANKQPGAENGECKLLGPFALFVQAGLGLLAVLSLVVKRWRERPQRPHKIWLLDASKQIFGAALVHVFNILMSTLSAGEFALARGVQDAAAAAAAAQSATAETPDGRLPNPCSFYLINIAVDTTVGVVIMVLILKVLNHAALLTPLANPPESIRSGYYGHPPRITWWLKQSVVYFFGLLLMKLCVFFLFELLPWIAWVGDWALRWTQGSEALQIAFTVFLFPLIMNAIQYVVIDSYIKDAASAQAGETSADEEDAESRQRLHDPEAEGDAWDASLETSSSKADSLASSASDLRAERKAGAGGSAQPRRQSASPGDATKSKRI